jgi:endonuclease/exonuclease/phosphatase family metal-dependent hydrolase
LNEDIKICPREKLLLYLSKQLSQWKAEGDNLIVMGDFNEDIRGLVILRTFKTLNMREAINSNHGNNPPNTFYNGRVPIDGIFVSNEMSILSFGYTPTKWVMAKDHRLLWADIEDDHLLGPSSPPVWKVRDRRLKADDPRVVQISTNKRKAND